VSPLALGVDIGGTGIKAGLVDTTTGAFVSERVKVATPPGGEPEDIARVVREVIDSLSPTPQTPVGVAFPSAIVNGVTRLAANVSKRWIDFAAEEFFEQELGRPIHFVNDADAAGFAEATVGAARGVDGLVIMITLGTGIGSALIYNGVLVPGSELGHLEIGGREAESFAANRVREAEGLDWPTWAHRLTEFFSHVEMLFSPQLFLIGGGVSKHAEDFIPLIDIRTPILAAELRNDAGVLGAATLAI
jgi:polyphosphate glucokinase